MLFDLLGDTHAHVHFGVLENLAVLLIIGAKLIYRLVKAVFPIRRRIIPIRPCLVENVSKLLPLSHLLAVLQSDPDSENFTEAERTFTKGDQYLES